MYIHQGHSETLFLYHWEITSATALIGVCAVVFALSALQPALNTFRQNLDRRRTNKRNTPPSSHHASVVRVNYSKNGQTSRVTKNIEGEFRSRDMLYMEDPGGIVPDPSERREVYENPECLSTVEASMRSHNEKDVDTYTPASTETHHPVLTAHKRYTMCEGHHLALTFLYVFQVTLAYFLMLVVMTFNLWLMLAVVGGAGTGYFLFGVSRPRRSTSGEDEEDPQS